MLCLHPKHAQEGQNVKNMNTNMNTIMNENPQTAARLVALFAVLYSVAMAPLKVAAKAVGLTMKNPENGRKNATNTAQYRTAVERFALPIAPLFDVLRGGDLPGCEHFSCASDGKPVVVK